MAEELVGCSERELQLLSTQLREHNRIMYGKEQVEITQKQLADFRRGNTAKEAILRQQRMDRETRAALVVLGGGSEKSTVASSGKSPPGSEEQPHVPTQHSENELLSQTGRYPMEDGDTLRVLRRLNTQ